MIRPPVRRSTVDGPVLIVAKLGLGIAGELFFFFQVVAITVIYTLSLHDALPIWASQPYRSGSECGDPIENSTGPRSEEHTSELQSRENIVCRLLLEKKKTITSSSASGDHLLHKSADNYKYGHISPNDCRSNVA